MNGSFNLTWAKNMAVNCKVTALVWHYAQDNTIEITEEGSLKIVRLGIKKSRFKILSWINKHRVLMTTANDLHANDAMTLIHNSVAWNMGFAAQSLSKKWNIPWFCTEHSSAFLAKSWNLKLKLSLWWLKKAKAVMVVSPNLKSLFEAKGLQNVQLIPNFVNPEINQFKAESSHGDYTFVHITNWDYKRKGTKEVLDCYEKLRKLHPCKLLLVANKVNIQDLGFSAKDLKEMGVEFSDGFVNPIDYYQWISRGQCMINYSRTETFGVTVAEAVKIGMHVIFTQSGGPEHFMQDTWGTKLENRHIERLEEAMIANKRSGISEVEREEFLSNKSIYEAHLKIYNNG
jgi:hypothetical protein